MPALIADNICNSTTENANSQCQTAVLNSISDFCFWGSPIANETIGDVEAEVVAYVSPVGADKSITLTGSAPSLATGPGSSHPTPSNLSR